jgi:hypothetical protein
MLNQALDEIPPNLPAVGEQQVSAEPVPAEPISGEPTGPRGRPWVKGQSGNPRGRPSRARQAQRVAEALIQRKTVPLTSKALEIALAGDRMLLRDLLHYIAPPRREPPVDLEFPVLERRKDLVAALSTIADAAASGEITSSQSASLTRMVMEVWRQTY